MTELYKKHRPASLKQLRGQDAVVAKIKSWQDRSSIPHAILLSGPSGTGKTTVARILRKRLRCSDMDYKEVNCSSGERGIDFVRDVEARIQLSPVQGETRVWVCDEAHQLTTAAQNAFLKILEDTPEHTYFMLATTEPERLKKTVLTRLQHLPFEKLPDHAVSMLIAETVDAEGISEFSTKVQEKIVEIADGGARTAMQLLDGVIHLKDEKTQMMVLKKGDIRTPSEKLLEELLTQKPNWNKIRKILLAMPDEQEGIRQQLLAYARLVLLNGGPKAIPAAKIIDYFCDYFNDAKGAGLALACWKICQLDAKNF